MQSDRSGRPHSNSAHHDEPARVNSASSTISASQKVQRTRQQLGLHPSAPIDEEHDQADYQHLLWSRIRLVLREPFAEFFGTFILVLFGDGAIAQSVLSKGQFGDYQTIPWGYGIGLMLGVYVAGDSGAYLNPAITLSSCIFRGLPWRRLPMYFAAQFLGAFLAAGVVYGNYVSAIDQYEGHGVRTVPGPDSKHPTAGIFATYPQTFLPPGSRAMSEYIASALLMFVILALKDDTNVGTSMGSGNFFPLILFFLMFGIAACFGWETGFALNPARDFGPRLMTAALGYGKEVWTAGGHYFWIPLIIPFFGCFTGAFLYDVFVYTGDSPVNTPWLGLKMLLHPRERARALREHERRLKTEGSV